ncbi:hypothetical protein B0H17DRAFT_1141004 [Mycena rosella]|uniref:Uncharacterized protein n=1 Tax=Mycena rosella TaxID=1033263 RepID=A0AAD7GAN4_MYCRO|nr:hypothetical protein B0H17DRAFT_1141004 [Mycena rosella]
MRGRRAARHPRGANAVGSLCAWGTRRSKLRGGAVGAGACRTEVIRFVLHAAALDWVHNGRTRMIADEGAFGMWRRMDSATSTEPCRGANARAEAPIGTPNIALAARTEGPRPEWRESLGEAQQGLGAIGRRREDGPAWLRRHVGRSGNGTGGGCGRWEDADVRDPRTQEHRDAPLDFGRRRQGSGTTAGRRHFVAAPFERGGWGWTRSAERRERCKKQLILPILREGLPMPILPQRGDLGELRQALAREERRRIWGRRSNEGVGGGTVSETGRRMKACDAGLGKGTKSGGETRREGGTESATMQLLVSCKCKPR